MRRYLFPGILAILAWGACSSDPTGPDQRPADQLIFLRLAANAPPFQSSTVSFYAKRGVDREGRIYFQDSEGGRGEEFARLKIDAGSLLARPDGTRFQTGDSVLVTLRIVDPLTLQIELLPSGLTFNKDRPAKLKLDYDFADDDYNRDGVVDIDDDAAELKFSIWRQRQPGEPWIRQGTVKIEDQKEVEAELTGFSRYAIAY